MTQIAGLLGDSVSVVERHYSLISRRREWKIDSPMFQRDHKGESI